MPPRIGASSGAQRSILPPAAPSLGEAAVQGLNQKREREHAELRARLERLEKLLADRQ